ncbi:MAG: hypothetical protein AB1304_01670 [Bacteroidota bacterium]
MKYQHCVTLIFCIFIFFACKKNWTCECCTTCSGTNARSTSQTEKLTKKKAIDKCNQGDKEFSFGFYSCKVDCSIKKI